MRLNEHIAVGDKVIALRNPKAESSAKFIARAQTLAYVLYVSDVAPTQPLTHKGYSA